MGAGSGKTAHRLCTCVPPPPEELPSWESRPDQMPRRTKGSEQQRRINEPREVRHEGPRGWRQGLMSSRLLRISHKPQRHGKLCLADLYMLRLIYHMPPHESEAKSEHCDDNKKQPQQCSLKIKRQLVNQRENIFYSNALETKNRHNCGSQRIRLYQIISLNHYRNKKIKYLLKSPFLLNEMNK